MYARYLLFMLFVLCPQILPAQDDSLMQAQADSYKQAQADDVVVVHRQRAFPQKVPPGNYSGITWLGGDRYAVVDDKSLTAGFHLMTIRTDSLTGKLLEVRADSFLTNGHPNRDEEGICYVPQSNTVFVSGEADGNIIEYDMHGQLTGRRLTIPEVYRSARSNGGFEALTYNTVTHSFWTCNEHTLKADGDKPSLQNRVPDRLRLQRFSDDLQPAEQYWYLTDTIAVAKQQGRVVTGVSGLAALDDGRLIVLERELYFPPKQVGSTAEVRLYVVRPARQHSGEVLEKQLLTRFRSRINLTARSFANYEGICVGPRLADGRQLLVLVCDSQNRYKGFLQDWFRTIVISQLKNYTHRKV